MNKIDAKKIFLIELGVEEKSGHVLNRITFQDGTSAMEKMVGNGSGFTKGEIAVFEITSPGKSGKPDWILFKHKELSDKEQAVVQKFEDQKKGFTTVKRNPDTPGIIPVKEFMIMSQNALTNAVSYCNASGVTDFEKVKQVSKNMLQLIIDNATEAFNKVNNV